MGDKCECPVEDGRLKKTKVVALELELLVRASAAVQLVDA